MTKTHVFVLNCGSSSIKFVIINPDSSHVELKGLAENIGTNRCRLKWSLSKKEDQKNISLSDYSSVIHEIMLLIKAFESTIFAIGHRVVHGGEYFSHSVLIDEEVLKKIQKCSPLAPLHNPINIKGIKAAQKEMPGLPQVAVFDTAFHQTIKKFAYLYPLPYSYYKEYLIRKYGFHGTSHFFVINQAAKKLDIPIEQTAFISAHLGNGCSVTAALKGKSVDTSMGLTPLEGLMMGERSGDIDPGIVGFLEEKLNLSGNEITEILNKKSGLLGVSEISGDMRLLEDEAQKKNEKAIIAIEIFCYRLSKYIASYFVPLQRLNALIFTGGIGENSSFIRSKVVRWLKYLNFTLCKKSNPDHGKNTNSIISEKNKTPIVMVINTNEELSIAKQTSAIVNNKDIE